MKKKYTIVYVFIILALMMTTGCKTGTKPSTSGAKSVSSGKTSTSKASASIKATKKSTSTQSTNEENTEKENNNENPEEDTNGENDSDQPEEGAIDMKGRVLVIGVPAENRLPTPEGDPLLVASYSVLADMEAKYNCKFEFDMPATIAQYKADYKQNLLAGTESRVALNVSDSDVFPGLAGALLPVEQYLPEVKKIMLNDFTQWQGVHLAVQATGQAERYEHFGLGYNKNLLENNGFPDIGDYYVPNGIWTWDTFVDIAMKLTMDLNGDGIIDQWGLASDIGELGLACIYSNDGRMVVESDGKVTFALDNPQALRGMQFMSDLFNTYKVIPAFKNRAQMKGLINQNNAVMTFIAAGIFRNWMETIMDHAYYAVMPKGPDASGYVLGYKHGNNDMYVFPANIETPDEVVCAVTDWLQAGINAVEGGPENYLHAAIEKWMPENSVNQQRVFNYQNYNRAISRVGCYGTLQADVVREVFRKVITQQTTAPAAIESIKPSMQSMIDDILGQ